MIKHAQSDSRDPPQRSKVAALFRRWCHIGPFEPIQQLSCRSLLGLPLLWASVYFVPLLSGTGAYFLPSNNLIDLIVFPTLIMVAAGAVILKLISIACRWIDPRFVTCGAIFGLSLFAITAVRALILASGHNWEQLLSVHGYDPPNWRPYLYKYGFFTAIFAAVWIKRRALYQLNRFLSGLGFAFGSLAAIRIVFLLVTQEPAHELLPAVPPSKSDLKNGTNAVAHPRRAVWVVFDESDYDRMYGEEVRTSTHLANFAYLATVGVFATNANSPAGSTIYSIPALLTGVPLGGNGVRIDRSGNLSLEKIDANFLQFTEEKTIFGALAARGLSASVIGFYHPYCKLFLLQRCDSAPWPDVGTAAAVFWANMPPSLSRKFASAYFGDTTENLLKSLPEYLARDDALTFVHLNFPHLPAAYADKRLHLAESSDPLEEYSRNLILADQVLGDIMHLLEVQASQRKVLLVVSTDHWLRKWSYGNTGEEVSRKVPFIAWTVGATKGVLISRPVSTVHTASMILDYLDGKISDQNEISEWWRDKTFYPSFLAPVK